MGDGDIRSPLKGEYPTCPILGSSSPHYIVEMAIMSLDVITIALVLEHVIYPCKEFIQGYRRGNKLPMGSIPVESIIRGLFASVREGWVRSCQKEAIMISG